MMANTPGRHTAGHLRVPGALSHHEYSEVIDRPDGCDSYLFLHFSSPIELTSTKGRCREKAGTWILYSPDFPQHYGLSAQVYRHDWVYLEGATVARLCSTLGLPLNTPVISTIGSQISSSVRRIADEIYARPPFWEQSVSSQVENLLIRLVRDIAECSHLSPQQKEVRTRFDQIRNEIRQAPGVRWPVRALARKAGMSESRFATVYGHLYGVSPARDMQDARMLKASQLLRHTTLPIKQIARETGYTDICYFHRVFTRHVGRTPGEFRRQSSRRAL